MVWTLETSNGFESDKIAALVVPYTRGLGLDIGCGQRKCWPHMIGVDSGHHFGKGDATIQSDGSNLALFSDDSLDFVFSSHTLEHIPPDKVPDVLKEWSRVIKKGGHLVLYLPSSNLYPKVGEEGANPDHKWDIYPGDVAKILQESTCCGWTQVEDEERSENTEYSLFEVYQKRDDGKFVRNLWQRYPDGKKRCLIIRYGAIGDQIMVSSILPLLKKQGYHVTYNSTPEGQNVLLHDPHIDEWFLQDKDQVPNLQLHPYWMEISKRYDKVINLCESVEGTLLSLPGRMQHTYSSGTRQRLMNKNYLEHTHDIADVDYVFSQKFYPSKEELEEITASRQAIDGPVIVWALNGSSVHKVYPFVDTVVAWLAERTDAHIFLMADGGIGKNLQDAILTCMKNDNRDLSRVHPLAGEFTVRQSLAFAQVADVVVGPETGVLNAVAFEDMPKVVMLSHSSEENLTKHWKNTHALIPESRAACYPCHKMHYDWSNCNKDEKTAAALCASAISPEIVFRAINDALTQRMESRIQFAQANVQMCGRKVA